MIKINCLLFWAKYKFINAKKALFLLMGGEEGNSVKVKLNRAYIFSLYFVRYFFQGSKILKR